MSDLKKTALFEDHVALDGKLVPFAGYAMPVQYPTGIIKEHLHTREAAGLFDVSHMGQVVVQGRDAAAVLESLVPVDIEGLGTDRQTYALFTNERGGVRDDLIITRWSADSFFLVVNAACKDEDIAHLRQHLAGQTLNVLQDQALLALQGPAARAVMQRLCPEAADLQFMQGRRLSIAGIEAYVTCSGYTGEDGFEIICPASEAPALWRGLKNADVAPCGLGARDTLRLEAALPLYGHELGMDPDGREIPIYVSVRKKPPEAKVLKLYYGLGSDQEMTLEEIGQIMGLTRERIRQIKEEAFEKIRSSKSFKYMHDYAEESPA